MKVYLTPYFVGYLRITELLAAELERQKREGVGIFGPQWVAADAQGASK